MSLWTGPQDRRTIKATSGRWTHNFTARGPLLLPGEAPSDVEMTLYSKGGHKTLRTSNKSITVGGTAVKLSSILRIKTVPEVTVTLLDNSILKGAISGMNAIEVDAGGKRTTINAMDGFDTILISTPALPAAVTYTIEASATMAGCFWVINTAKLRCRAPRHSRQFCQQKRL